MAAIVKKFIRLIAGLFLYSVGIVMTINADIGLAPWDVFHQGISIRFGITMGQASIIMGLIILIFNGFLGEKLGWGTVLNMFLIGTFLDVLMLNNLIPTANNLVTGILMMLLGLFVIGIASYYYISAGLGSGPRDGLMVALTKLTKKSVRFVRNSIESTVLVIGYFLGGKIGIGTLIMATTVGYFVQFAFKIFKFDVASIEHRFISEDILIIKDKLLKVTDKNG